MKLLREQCHAVNSNLKTENETLQYLCLREQWSAPHKTLAAGLTKGH